MSFCKKNSGMHQHMYIHMYVPSLDPVSSSELLSGPESSSSDSFASSSSLLLDCESSPICSSSSSSTVELEVWCRGEELLRFGDTLGLFCCGVPLDECCGDEGREGEGLRGKDERRRGVEGRGKMKGGWREKKGCGRR